MPRSWPVRLQALVLALLMLGGGGRLPVLDGIVFHHQPGSIPSGAALLAEDAVAPHGAADHLAAGFPASGLAPEPEGPVHDAPAAEASEPFAAHDAVRVHEPDPLTRPRAPPLRA
jgi:hypothetical protein